MLVVPLAVATGMGFALFDVFWNTTMAEQIPPHALSRASAWEWMGSLVLLPVGYLAAGPLAEATSTETVLLGGAILTAVGARTLGSCRARRECCAARSTPVPGPQCDGSHV